MGGWSWLVGVGGGVSRGGCWLVEGVLVSRGGCWLVGVQGVLVSRGGESGLVGVGAG